MSTCPAAVDTGVVRRGYSASGGAEHYLLRFAEALRAARGAPVLFASGEWPAEAWPHGGILRVGGHSPMAFANALQSLDPGRYCRILFSLERVLSCDVYRAGDGVHRAWMQRRARFESPWRSALRNLNPKHREVLQLEHRLFAKGGARHIIANAQFVADEILRHYGCPADRITVVPNGIPPQSPAPPGIRDALRATMDLVESDFLILFAGSGWDRKGLRFAMEAVGRMPAASRARLIVAGRGRASEFRGASRTSFLGPVNNLAHWMSASDAFVLPTLYDPFSNACLEALAAGLPVVTTSANGFSEIIRPGEEGSVLEDPSDIATLAAELTRWADPVRRRDIRPRLLALAAQYSIDRNLKSTIQVLDSIRN